MAEETPDEQRERLEEKEAILASYDKMSTGETDDAIESALFHPDWREIFEAFDERTPGGFNPDWDCIYKGSILILAIEGRRYEVAEYLLSLGADANTTFFYGNTPLEEAARCRDEGALTLSELISCGFKIEGDGTLHFAAAAGCLAKVEVLLGAGMDLGILKSGPHRDVSVKGTPLHEAAAAHWRASQKVSESGGDRWDPDEQVKVIEALLAAGADPEASDEEGTKPTAWAAARPGYPGTWFRLRDEKRLDEEVDERKHVERVQALLKRSKRSTPDI